MPSEPIEVEYQEEAGFTPSVAAPPRLDRADVLTQLRLCAAEASGFAALVEGSVGKVRAEFIDAWRRWFGAFLGRFFALERLPFDPAKTDEEVKAWQGRLRAWRAGFQAEVGAPVGAAVPAPPPAPQPQAAPAERKGWPTWAKLLGLGGGAILAYKVVQWALTPSYTSTAQVVGDVVDTARTVNSARQERK